MFTSKISTLTNAELAADIATCRTVLSTGHVNGVLLDGDTETYYRDWLECAEEEWEIRAEAASEKSAPEVPACGGGLNVDLFVAAFGRTPEEEFDAEQTRIDPTEYERAA